MWRGSELWEELVGSGRCWLPGWVSSRCAEGVLVVWESDSAAGGWPNGCEPDAQVASGVVGVWEQCLAELGLVAGWGSELWEELVGSGRCWCLAGCLQGVAREFWWSGRENWLQVAGGMVVNLKRRWLQESWESGGRFWVSWA